MTQKEILQYNKRCNNFLGLEILKDEYCYDYPDFHSDWNWIMEVVEAIEEKTKIKTIDECSEDEWYATIGVTRLTITSKKEAVVQAINQFLIWYEQNKTT